MTDLGRPGPITAPTSDTSPFAERLRDLLFDGRAPDGLRDYFREPAEENSPGYTGRHFERFAGGGDQPGRADAVTAEDLIAVQTLSVVMPAETSVQLLEGHLGVEVGRLLRQIPTDVCLGAPDATAHLADGAPGDRCWRLLTNEHDVGATLAGKLLARKRPHLLPVYDDVVKCALGEPKSFWTLLHEAIGADEHGLRPRLAELRADVPYQVSDLRIIDVVIWMGHRVEHQNVCKRRGRATREAAGAGS